MAFHAWNPGKISKRIDVRADNSALSLRYDIDNAYPQRMYQHYLRSGYTKLCVEIYAKFIFGGGLADKKLYKTVVNDKGQTLDQVLRPVIKDFSVFKGFAIHFNYNALYAIHSIQRIPFEYIRLGLPDDQDYIGKVGVYNNWDRSNSKNYKHKKIDRLDVFNPNPDVVRAQMEHAGGIEKYLGQVLYYTGDTEDYPLCSFDSVIELVKADAQLDVFKNSNIENGFLVSYIVEYPGEFESAAERKEFDASLADLQGAKKAGSFVVLEVPSNSNPNSPGLKFTKVETQNNDRLFEWTEQSTNDKIRKNYLIPPDLLGEFKGGALSAQQISDSYEYYNSVTQDERLIFEEILTKIFSYWRNPIPVVDYSIIPLQYVVKKPESLITTQPNATPTANGNNGN